LFDDLLEAAGNGVPVYHIHAHRQVGFFKGYFETAEAFGRNRLLTTNDQIEVGMWFGRPAGA
jgi:hypothetical protein